MRLCVFGAGAVGGLLGARLAQTGQDVSLIARGRHLAAIRAGGLTVRGADGGVDTVRLPASDDPGDFGPQDAVLVTAKAHDAAAAAESMRPLLGPDTAVLTAMNGIPWWYFHRAGGRLDGTRVAASDPGGAQWTHLGPARAVGAVTWLSAELPEPGVVRHTGGNRLPVGEPDGSRSARAGRLSAALAAAGFKAPVRRDIRAELWLKLWGNLAFNPVSLLTQATLEDLAGDAGVRGVLRAMMIEAEAVAGALGIRFPIGVDERISWAERVGPHRTSTLQDLLARKPVELDALLGAVVEIAGRLGVETPTLRHVFALAALRAREAGCYGAALPRERPPAVAGAERGN